MRKDISSPRFNDDDDGPWREIEELVGEAAVLARQPMSNREFFTELLRRLMQATGAVSTAAWSLDGSNRLRQEYRTSSATASSLDDTTLACLQASLSEVARHHLPRMLAPHSVAPEAIENPTEYALFACPVVFNGNTVAVLELLHYEDASPAELQSVEELLDVFGDVALDFHRDRKLREYHNREQSWAELDGFAERVHQSLDWKATCYAVGNEAARVTGCERVSVLHRRRVLAISGIDTVNRRSNASRSLEALVRVVERSGDPLWHPNEDETLPPQLQQRLEAYRDCTHVRSVAVLPLRRVAKGEQQRKSVGVLAFERFDGEPWTDAQRRRVEAVCRHAAPAMQNASELSGLPLLWLSRLAEYLLWPFGLRQLPKTALLIAALVGGIAALCLVPTDFVIDGRGELQPAMQRHIFAPADAVIESIHVEHSGKVAAGDVLLELRDSELDFKMASILGDLQTQQKRLETVRARRLNFARLNSDDSTEFDDLTSEEERLKTTIASLAEQKEIVSRQLAELSVASNIDGEVLTWGIDEILKSRAVRRGERLLTVADTDGEWRLEMWIADHDVEHVIHARRQTEELAASFVLASRSGTAVHGHVEQIGMATEMTSEGRPGVRVVIAFDRHDVESLRPGTTAFVKIHCGRRAIGYVWFREVLEVVRTRLLF